MERDGAAAGADCHPAPGALTAELAAAGCRALLVVASSSRDPDLAPFVGGAHLGECFLIAGAGDLPYLAFLTAMERQEAASTGCLPLPPARLGMAELLERQLSPSELWCELLRRGLQAAEVPAGRIAVAGRPSAGVLLAAGRELAEAGWELVDGEPVSRRLRKLKSARELAEARRVATATVAAMERVAELLAAAESRQKGLWLAGERLTAGRLRREVALLLAGHQLEQPEGNILAAGAATGVPHTRGDDERTLRAGEPLIVDLFPRGRLFADCTRTFCVGTPPEPLAAAHAAVLGALAGAYRECAAGVRGWDLQDRVCARFEKAGYATARQDPETVQGYVHGLGHGVGYELHELPSFRRGATDPEGRLEEGDLFTLEPGLYDPVAGWGVRLEDLCLLGPAGVENLTPAPYALDPRAWRS